MQPLTLPKVDKAQARALASTVLKVGKRHVRLNIKQMPYTLSEWNAKIEGIRLVTLTGK